MGKQLGVVHIGGRFNDVQLYFDRRKGYSKMANPVSKERILKDAGYVQTRKSMAEFKGASLAASALQVALGPNWNRFRARFFRSQLGSLTRGVVSNGSGLMGKRSFEVGPNLNFFEGVELDARHPFQGSFKARHEVTVNPDRNTATLAVQAFNSLLDLRVPGSATHFHLFMSVGVLTDFVHVGGKKVYRSTQPSLLGLNEIQYTPAILCDGTPNPGFQLVTSLPNLPVLPTDACLVVCLGIEFLKFVNNVEELFAEGKSMQIHAAF